MHDGWSSKSGISILGVIIQYINNDWVLVQEVVDFKEIIGHHTGENLAEVRLFTFLLSVM